jgi:hypothetical protein
MNHVVAWKLAASRSPAARSVRAWNHNQQQKQSGRETCHEERRAKEAHP